MNVQELLASVTDGVTVRRVFGDPIESAAGLVIPVAWIAGGAGAGHGDDNDDSGGTSRSGSGGGLGFRAGPVGVYRVTAEGVTWHPAVNVNAVVLGAQALAALGLALVLRRPGRRRT